MKRYEPEGLARSGVPMTEMRLRQAMERGTVLEAMVTHCDAAHTLYLDLGEAQGRICREEAAVGVAEGTARETAVLSLVGRVVCFRVMELSQTTDGLIAGCSRRLPQQEARDTYLETLHPGDILPAVVTGLARFGAFCDIGRGVTALLPTGWITVTHTEDASERFSLGQQIVTVVREVADGRIALSHRELLGTWRDNAAQFAPGQVTPGIVRGVMPFGVFVELTPNLAGLCEPRTDLQRGERVSVLIRSIQPEKQTIKLSVVSKLPPSAEPPRYRYVRRTGHIDFWQYAPTASENGGTPILTCF